MLRSWKCSLRVTQHQTKLLLSSPLGDLLKARLDTEPQHPRALLTLLEGLSLWAGERLCVALSVDERCPASLHTTLLGGDMWPAESQLVRFDIEYRAPRQARLPGMGDFRALRRSGA